MASLRKSRNLRKRLGKTLGKKSKMSKKTLKKMKPRKPRKLRKSRKPGKKSRVKKGGMCIQNLMYKTECSDEACNDNADCQEINKIIEELKSATSLHDDTETELDTLVVAINRAEKSHTNNNFHNGALKDHHEVKPVYEEAMKEVESVAWNYMNYSVGYHMKLDSKRGWFMDQPCKSKVDIQGTDIKNGDEGNVIGLATNFSNIKTHLQVRFYKNKKEHLIDMHVRDDIEHVDDIKKPNSPNTSQYKPKTKFGSNLADRFAKRYANSQTNP
jgi:hypothetical protein